MATTLVGYEVPRTCPGCVAGPGSTIGSTREKRMRIMFMKVTKWVALCSGTLLAAAVPGCDTIMKLVTDLLPAVTGLAT